MFSKGADNISLSGTVLSADIPDQQGRKRTASIDLNDYIGRDEYGKTLLHAHILRNRESGEPS